MFGHQRIATTLLSSLYLLSLLLPLLGTAEAFSMTQSDASNRQLAKTLTASEHQHSSRFAEQQEWMKKSIAYYAKVSRQSKALMSSVSADFVNSDEFLSLAKQHYFAYRKVRDGKHKHAEMLYRRIIDNLLEEEDSCDHAKLAVTTLLLALHLQRMGDMRNTRAVFHKFFRIAVVQRDEHSECACSAKVLGAYALFEMKQGNCKKALRLARIAESFDDDLAAVLQWKQFRDVAAEVRR